MLITTPNIAKPDDFYAALLSAHTGLNDAQSQQLNAALALTLANHVGDAAVLQAALDVARASVLPAQPIRMDWKGW
jgi:3-(3-hydroxy-phenyl)propionate hydroxylase